MGQRIVAEAPTKVDPGKGSVLLTTRGYATPDAEPMLVKKQVTILEPEGPWIRRVTMEGYESTPDKMPLAWNTPVTIEGKKIKLEEGDKLLTELHEDGVCVDKGTYTTRIEENTDGKIVIDGLTIDSPQQRTDGDWYNAETYFVIVKADGTRIAHPVTFGEG